MLGFEYGEGGIKGVVYSGYVGGVLSYGALH
jgi:hypothetical protein